MATKLILIRHGQTEWNLKKRYCGFIDIPLNEQGRKQAKLLSARLKRELVDKVYCSDRKRAMQTARIVFKGVKIEEDPALREIHFGIIEGLTHDEALKRYPEVYSRWLKNPYSVTIPGGESMQGFKKRIVKALKKIIAGYKDKTVAVVCHGGAISVFITHILKTKDFWKHISGSASLSVIEYKKNNPMIQLLNDTSHLLIKQVPCL